MMEILLIEKIYRSAARPVTHIPALVKALNQWYWTYADYNYLHPCLIEGKAALVCQQNLSLIAPHAYAELQAIAEHYALFLKENTRSQQIAHGYQERRQHHLAVLSFCIGLLTATRLVSADELMQSSVSTAYTGNANPTLQYKVMMTADGRQFVNLRQTQLASASQVMAAFAKLKTTMPVDVQAGVQIRTFLHQIYQAEADDPPYIKDDLAELAHYYAAYPEVIHLLQQFEGKKLILKYKADNWQTQAWGSPYAVESATIYFDTRLGAAKLIENPDCNANPACSITPADALLHEILHAKLMLLDSQHFIEIGGMQPTLYLFEHEKEVIAAENSLYKSLNNQDGMVRPLRNRHIGNLVHVGCAVCLPAELIAAK